MDTSSYGPHRCTCTATVVCPADRAWNAQHGLHQPRAPESAMSLTEVERQLQEACTQRRSARAAGRKAKTAFAKQRARRAYLKAESAVRRWKLQQQKVQVRERQAP